MKKEYNILYNEFKEWLIGILEDDPIPYEITTLYFFYGKFNNCIFISFKGTEIDKKENSDFTYNPLEAEYFYSSNLFKLFQSYHPNNLRQFIKGSIENLKKTKEFSEFNRKTIKIKRLYYYI